MSGPRLLLLDEPSLGLAPIIVDQIFDLLAGLREDGVTILLVEQNVHRALEIADRAYVLVNGRIELPGRRGRAPRPLRPRARPTWGSRVAE